MTRHITVSQQKRLCNLLLDIKYYPERKNNETAF